MFRRILTVTLVAAMALVGLLFSAAPAHADAPTFSAPKQYYLALGDSVTFGYQQAIVNAQVAAKGSADPTAFVGFVDYFGQFLKSLNPNVQTVNLGCPGETTTSFISGSCTTYPFALHTKYTGSQLQAAVAFLTAHPGQVSPITVEIGPNDILNLVGSTCKGPTDLACVTQGLPGVLKTLQTNLATIVGTLRATAPDAEIIVVNAYNPLAASNPATNALASPLLQIYQGVAAALKAYYADIFTPFNLSQPQPQNICFLTNVCGPLQDIHPTLNGYRLIAQVLAAASGYLAMGAGTPLSARLSTPASLISQRGHMWAN